MPEFDINNLFIPERKKQIRTPNLNKLSEKKQKLEEELKRIDKKIEGMRMTIPYNENWEEWRDKQEAMLGERREEVVEKLEKVNDELAGLSVGEFTF
jgi:chromosome segregation ATPase